MHEARMRKGDREPLRNGLTNKGREDTTLLKDEKLQGGNFVLKRRGRLAWAKREDGHRCLLDRAVIHIGKNSGILG